MKHFTYFNLALIMFFASAMAFAQMPNMKVGGKLLLESNPSLSQGRAPSTLSAGGHRYSVLSAPSFIDTTFGTNGTVRNAISGGNGTNDQAYAVAIQSDGKIVAAGVSAVSGAHYAFALSRYNINGTLDSTFGANGTVRNTISGGGGVNDQAYSVAIQSDGKIVVAGFSLKAPAYAFALARYNVNGTLDSTFGTNGTVRNAISGGSGTMDEAYGVAIQSDGKIVAAGFLAPVLSIILPWRGTMPMERSIARLARMVLLGMRSAEVAEHMITHVP